MTQLSSYRGKNYDIKSNGKRTSKTATKSWFNIDNFSHLVCLVATFCLMAHCIDLYLKNEDVSVVGNRKFHSKKDAIYPSFTLCVLPPLDADKLSELGMEGVNVTTYWSFLRGYIWDERMLEIDYDNVTVSLKENIHYVYIAFHNRTFMTYDPEIVINYRSALRKCFEVRPPSMEENSLLHVSLYLKKTLFPRVLPDDRGFYPPKRDLTGMQTYFHYQGQRLTGYSTFKDDWRNRTNGTKNYRAGFDPVKNIDVMHLRNKPEDPCVEDWQNYDQFIKEELMKEVGCRPPQWKTPLNLTLCWNKEQMSTYSFREQPRTPKLQTFPPPCRVIDRLDYVYKEKDISLDLFGR